MASDVQICNLALLYLGEAAITSLASGTPNANRCQQFYTIALEGVLRDHAWNFAQRAVRLSPAELPEGFSGLYAYAYTTPPDMMTARELFAGSATRNVDFEVANDGVSRVILTNISPAYLRYTAKVSDANIFDPIFVEAFALKLAAILARPITKNAQTEQSMLTRYANQIMSAKAADAAEGEVEEIEEDSWILARTLTEQN